MTVFTRTTHARGIGGASWSSGSSPAFAGIVRPFAGPWVHVLHRMDRIRPIDGEEQEAKLCIGGPPEPGVTTRTDVRVNWPDDHDEEEEAIERPRYKELQAIVRDVRVTNPTDDEIWVDLIARNSSLLQTDKGEEFWIDWLQDLTSQKRAE